MMTFHKRDANEKAIIAALVAIGARVTKINGCPGGDGDWGVPDLLVGYRGRTILLEVKEPGTHQKTKKRAGGADVPENAKGQLTPTQVDWWSKWVGGEAYVVETPEQAVALARGDGLPDEFALAGGSDDLGPRVTMSNARPTTHTWLTPGQADALAGALHDQAAQARAMYNEQQRNRNRGGSK